MSSLRLARAPWLACLVLAGIPALVSAQPTDGNTGSVSGRVVLSADLAPIHGATVIVVGARRTATTGEDGVFSIQNVAAGTYEVIAQREHLSAARQVITISAGQDTRVEFALTLAATHEEVTVTASATGTATAFDSFNAVTTLDSTEIARNMGSTIADVLQNAPGVSKRSFGPGASRPVIRGFDGDRVLIMQDGVRTGDLSSQSGDHGVSIDPAGLSRLEVVKGPATLLYGSNAIGGVVNAISPQDAFRAIPFTGTLGGATIDLGNANEQAGASINAQRGHGPWLLFGNVTSRKTSDYDSPERTIANSATRLTTGEGGVGWSGERVYVGLGGGFERNRYGVPFAGFLAGEEDAEVDLSVRRGQGRLDAGFRNLGGTFVDTVKVSASFLDYAHDEIEIADGTETLGTRFQNQVITTRLEVEQRRTGRLGGRLGGEFFTRDYRAMGEEALAPDTRHQSLAAFAFEEMDLGRQRIQFGLRFERNRYRSVRDRTFYGVSGSAGLHRDIGASSAFVANLTASSRAPALEELYNLGPHPGNMAFEIGNPDLGAEQTRGLDLSVRTRTRRMAGEINVFAYDISNFVFLNVTEDLEEGLRVAGYAQADSLFVGAEASGHVELHDRAVMKLSAGWVRARLTDTNEALPRIPPVHGRLEITGKAGAFTFGPDVTFSARQAEVFRNETPTSGWVNFGFNASWERQGSHSSHLVALSAFNLGDTTYRLHTSFLKDLAPEIGRGVKMSYTMRFF